MELAENLLSKSEYILRYVGYIQEYLDASSPRSQQIREYLERDRPQQVRRLSAWDRWWVLLGVCAVWATAWAVRRSGGLV